MGVSGMDERIREITGKVLNIVFRPVQLVGEFVKTSYKKKGRVVS